MATRVFDVTTPCRHVHQESNEFKVFRGADNRKT